MNKQVFVSPGQMIKSLLINRNWTQKILAIIMAVDEPVITNIIANRRPITAEMAMLLERIFEIPAEDFLTLQKTYDLARARIETSPDPALTTRAHLFGGLPVAEMIKRGWLEADSMRDVAQVEMALAKFFGVESPDHIETLPHAAKKTETFTPATPSQLAWIYRVRQIASEMLVAKYSPFTVRAAITRLDKLLSAPEEARKVPRILAECGIRYLIVETLPGAKIDGVCLWLNGSFPVIGMTLRYDRIDNFWFVLRHELEHILRQHGKKSIMLDTELEGEKAGTGANIATEEREANEAAAEFCVPQGKLDGFIARKAPFFNQRDILGFAKTLQIHAGLVAGQLQHKTGRYDRFRQHLAKIRFAVAPCAMVDGWGDIAPVGL
jgi:HTH-type transcriptional regulator/antitoxin HigA